MRHKHLGGIGIITGQKTVVSNITMGSARKFIVEWIEGTSELSLVSELYQNRQYDYFPAFLERVAPTDKNCPPK